MVRSIHGAFVALVFFTAGCGDLTMTALVAEPDGSLAGSEPDAGPEGDTASTTLSDASADLFAGDVDAADRCAGKACGDDCTPPGMGALLTCNADGQCVAGPVGCE